MRIAICDDNALFLEELKVKISNWEHKPSSLFLDTFIEGDSLLIAHAKKPFDAIFLDIVMPILDGIETARELRMMDKMVKIVFLTSSKEYALDSYSVRAYHYLLKPICDDVLYELLDELYTELSFAEKFFTLKTLQGVSRINGKDIEYIEAQNKHVLFVLTDGRILRTSAPFYSYKDHLLIDDGFFKCHRSYIINIHHIASFNAKEVQMRSGKYIPISKNLRKNFEDTYFHFMFQKAGDFA